MNLSDSLDSRMDSPRDESDEGVSTKGSNSQEGPFGSSPRGKCKTALYESEESSGILDDSDTERPGHHDGKLHERSWSLDVTFALEDKKLKIVDEDEPDSAKLLNRRPSLTPSGTSTTVKWLKYCFFKKSDVSEISFTCQRDPYIPSLTEMENWLLKDHPETKVDDAGAEEYLKKLKRSKREREKLRRETVSQRIG